ncbi:uncharacterized protein LOC143276404 [Babylonia areolata]|uniref:uncharacterized protein LOC143276404 n=1 Tax=Babylonia areolata TaxID=304850 RepID=UPI003FD3F3D9
MLAGCFIMPTTVSCCRGLSSGLPLLPLDYEGRRLFHARDLNKTATQHFGAMIFRTVEVNRGSHYAAHSGMFTAPQTGLYCFAATVASRRSDVTVCGSIGTGGASRCAVEGGKWGRTGTSVTWLRAGQGVCFLAGSPPKEYSDGPSIDFSGALLLPSS